MTADFVTYSKTSLKGINKELTDLLKVDAKNAGWPNNIVKQLRAAVEDLKIVVYYPEMYAQKIDDLEYGNGQDSPQAVFRRFIAKNMGIIGNDLADSSMSYLVEQGIIP
jgi:hypothetical protein